MVKARRYAEDLLKLVPAFQRNWNYGNAIHDGHMVLGRVALAAGDLATARKELLEAGKTPGSPQLNSFGPNMALALDLLRRGEKDIVREYFAECGRFWVSGRGPTEIMGITYARWGHSRLRRESAFLICAFYDAPAVEPSDRS